MNDINMIKLSSQLLFIIPLALGIGIAMAFQTAINTQLKTYLHSPIQAAFLSFLFGTIILAVMVYFQGAAKPSLSELLHIPWFLWLGGILGVYAISTSIYTAPKLGFLILTGLVIFRTACHFHVTGSFWLVRDRENPYQLAAPTGRYCHFPWCFTDFTTLIFHNFKEYFLCPTPTLHGLNLSNCFT